MTGVYIQFDVDTNLAGNGDGVSFPAVNCFENADIHFGEGAFLIWRTAEVVYAMFGPGVNMTGATVTTQSLIQIQVNSIALAQNQYLYAQGMFMLEPPRLQQIGRTSSVIIAPADVDGFESAAFVDGSLSGKYGGRWMDFAWGLRAEKCIDVQCINRLSLMETDTTWILPAQNQAFENTVSSARDIKLLLLNGVSSKEQAYSSMLRLFSGNVISWTLQTSNFLTNSINCNDTCRYSQDGFHGYTSVQYSAACCTSLSNFATATTRIRCIQGPKVTINAPPFLIIGADFPLKIGSDVQYQCCDLIQKCNEFLTCLSAVSFEWSVQQLALQSSGSKYSFWQQREAQMQGMDNLGAEHWSSSLIPGTRTGVLAIPPFFLECEKYYRINLNVRMAVDNFINETRSAFIVVFVRRQNPYGMVSISGFNNSLMTSLTLDKDISLITVANSWEGLNLLPIDDSVIYNWTCIEFDVDEMNTVSPQGTPADLKYSPNFRYWEDDEGITNTPFFHNKMKHTLSTPFTACNSLNITNSNSDLIIAVDALDSSKVYLHNLKIKVVSPRDAADIIPQVYTSRMGFTFLKTYGTDQIGFSNKGRAIHLNIAPMYTRNPYKVLPGRGLAIEASVDLRSLALNPFLQRLDGLPGCGTCFFLWQDLSKQYVFGSSVIPFEGVPAPVYLSIPASAVTGDNIFLIRLTLLEVKDVMTVKGFADLYLSVNSPPRGGHIEVSPSAGYAYETAFNLTALQWDDSPEDLPLQFAFSYRSDKKSDVTILRDYEMVPSSFELLPLASSIAAANPCRTGNIGNLMCAMITVFVDVKDVWGGNSQSSVSVQVFLNKTSVCTYSNICKLYNIARQNGFLSLNINAMLNRFQNILTLLEEYETSNQLAAAQRSGGAGNCPTSADSLRSYILNTTLQYLQYQNGSLVPRSPFLLTKVTLILTNCLVGVPIDQELFDRLQKALSVRF